MLRAQQPFAVRESYLSAWQDSRNYVLHCCIAATEEETAFNCARLRRPAEITALNSACSASPSSPMRGWDCVCASCGPPRWKVFFRRVSGS